MDPQTPRDDLLDQVFGPGPGPEPGSEPASGSKAGSPGGSSRGPASPRGRKQTTRAMVSCAVLSALAVVALGVGTLIEVMDLTAASLAAVVILLALQVFGPRYALLAYAVTGVLGLLLMPQSLAVWTFVGLTGYYPVLKARLDRLPRLLAWTLKLALFAAVMAACVLVFHFLVMGGTGAVMDSFLAVFGEAGGRAALGWAVLALSLLTFVLFDLLISRLLILYRLRWQRRVEKFFRK